MSFSWAVALDRLKNLYHWSKLQIWRINWPTPFGPHFYCDCDTNHYEPVRTVGITVNFDNNFYWDSSTKPSGFFLIFFLSLHQIHILIRYNNWPTPIFGGIVTPTAIAQQLRWITQTIITTSLFEAVPQKKKGFLSGVKFRWCSITTGWSLWSPFVGIVTPSPIPQHLPPPGWLSGERIGRMTWWLRVRAPVEIWP